MISALTTRGPQASRRSQALLLLLATVSVAAYFPLDRHVAHGHDLTMSLDARIPFVPLFGVPYLAFLVILPLSLLAGLWFGRDLKRAAIALAVVYLVSDVFFIVYPTYAPRPAHITGLGGAVVRFIFAHDAPYNDFPSEHVASAVILALHAWGGSSVVRVSGFMLAAIVAPSTVLIRQHSLVGALAGLVLAVLAWGLIGLFLRRQSGLVHEIAL